MQVRVWREDDTLVVDIPSSDAQRRVFFDLERLEDATADDPLVENVPDPGPTTTYGTYEGEAPVYAQTRRSGADHQETRDQIAREQGNAPIPNTEPGAKTQASSVTGSPFSTAQIGNTPTGSERSHTSTEHRQPGKEQPINRR